MIRKQFPELYYFTPSIIVGKEGQYYYAMKYKDKYPFVKSSDASKVVEKILDTLNVSPKGGRVRFGIGRFDFKGSIVSVDDIHGLVIEGEEYGTGEIGTVILDGGIKIRGVSTSAWGNKITSIGFYNSDKTLTAIHLVRPDCCVIRDVQVKNYDTGVIIDVTDGGLDNQIINAIIMSCNTGLKIVGNYSPAIKISHSRITGNTVNIQIGSDTEVAPWNVKFVECDIEAGNIVIDGRAEYRDIRDISIVSSYMEGVTMDIYANPNVILSLLDNYIEPGNPLNINVHEGTVYLTLLNRTAKVKVNVDSGATLIIHQHDYGYYNSIFSLGKDYSATAIEKGTIDGTLKILPPNTLAYTEELPASGDYRGQMLLYYDGTYYYIAVWNGSSWVKTQLS